MGFYWIFFLLLLLASVYYLYSSKKRRQLEFIQSYRFYSTIGKKIQEKYPNLRDEDVTLVLSALKDYFYICNKAKRRMVSMPSLRIFSIA